MRALIVGILVAAVAALPARADDNDLTISRLAGPPAMGSSPSLARQSMYRGLLSELGTAMAPGGLAPADTLGYSGFGLALESSSTQISNRADFWQQGAERVSGGFLSTLSVMVKKGLWLPLPSLELGAGATKLIDSNLYALQGYAKLALHEGFHDWPIPSVAFRAAVSHLLGASEVDLTTVALGVVTSKSFGILGTVAVDPYLGFDALLHLVRGRVIDTTPSVDAFHQGPGATDLDNNTSFPDPGVMPRWRLFAGFRLVYTIVAFSGELSYTLCNGSGARCGAADPTRATDRSGGQLQINLAAGLVF